MRCRHTLSFRRSGRLRRRWAAVPLCVMAFWALPASARIQMRFDERIEHEFMWREAAVRAASAESESDFMRVAETYRALIRAGVRNGPLFYNLGTALLKADRYDEAMNALTRAERHMGANPEIRRNMRLALARERDPSDVFLPWYRLFLFWHYRLGFHARSTLAAIAFVVFWLTMCLVVVGWRAKPIRALRAAALALLILYGSSTGASLLQERRDDMRDRVMEAERKGGNGHKSL